MRNFGDISEGRSNNFDFLRFLLATLVLFAHSWPLSGDFDHEPISRLTRGQIDGGSLAVDLFFVASGFLVTQSWLRSSSFWQYLTKRVLRIYPGFLVASLIAACALAPMGADSVSQYFHNVHIPYFVGMAATLSMPKVPPTFLHNPFAGVVNGSLWTIRYEFGCYLIVAAIGLASVLRKPTAMLGLFAFLLVAAGSQQYWFPHVFGRLSEHNQDLLGEWPRFLAYFFAGTLSYLFSKKIPYDSRIVASCIVAVVGLSVLGHGLQELFPILGTYLFLAAALKPDSPCANFGRRGDFSYGVYLYAFPIQQVVAAHIDTFHKPLLLFAIAYPITIVAAAVSWHAIEKPALRLKRRTTKKNEAAAALSEDGTRTEMVLPS